MDKAELKKDRAVFDCDIAKKEKQKYVEMYQQSQSELYESRARCGELDQQVHEMQIKIQQMQQEAQRNIYAQ